jgi:long-chain fatty acid transport protein
MNSTLRLSNLPFLTALLLSGSAFASGFQLQNQTGSGNGTAFAGAAAAAEDAGTIMWNPAGMTYLPTGHSVSVAGTLLSRKVDFTNQGSSASVTPLGTIAPLTVTGNGGNAGGLSLVPAGYWAYAISPDLRVGIGVSPTFGNLTEYSDDFVGRNAGYYADMKQININPSLAYKLNQQVSIGFGINIAHNATHFRQGYPISAAPNVNACSPLPTCAALNSTNNYVDIKGDDWAVGYNLGAMFQLTPATRFGVSYRSALKFNLEGDWDVNTPVAGGAVFGDQQIETTLKTPANLSMALSHKLNDKLELLGDLTWTDWSVVDTLTLKNRSSGATVNALSYKFKDTWRVGLGANYQYNDAWKLRFGLAYDQTPVQSAADRTMTLPDSDRTWLSFGARYQMSKVDSIDLGYTHLFMKQERTERVVSSATLGALQVIRGTWDNSVDILSMQYNRNF